MAATFTPDGRYLVTACDPPGGGKVAVRDGRTGATVRTLDGPNERFRAVASSPDGRRVATASNQGAKIWDPDTGRLVAVLAGHTSFVHDLAFSPDGLAIATAGDDRTVRGWELRTSRELFALRGHTAVPMCLAYHPSGEMLYTGDRDGMVKVWETAAPDLGEVQVSPAGQDREPEAIGWTASGELIVVGRAGGVSRIDPAVPQTTGRTWLPLHGGWMTPAEPATVDDTGSWVAGRVTSVEGRADEVGVWDAQSGRRRATLRGYSGDARFVSLAPGGGRVAIGCVTQTGRWQVTVRDVDTAAALFERTDPAAAVARLAFDPTSGLLAVSWEARTSETDSTRRLEIWDLATGRAVFELAESGPAFRGIAFDPTGKRLAAVAGDRAVLLVEVADGSLTRTTEGPDRAMDVAFSPDATRLAVAGRHQINLLTTKGAGVAVLRGRAHLFAHTNGFNPRVRFSPDGRKLGAVCFDIADSIAVWNSGDDGEDLPSRLRFAARRADARHLVAAGRAIRENPTAAQFHLDQLGGRELNGAWPTVARARLAAALGRATESDRALELATRQAPDDPHVWMAVSAIRADRHQLWSAKTAFVRSIGIIRQMNIK
ncbi:MAG: hypothetical protein ACRC7O_12270 [Fimbriiglobus sp.]